MFYTFIRIRQMLKIQRRMAAVVTESGLRDARYVRLSGAVWKGAT
jgi:hypothetical protein